MTEKLLLTEIEHIDRVRCRPGGPDRMGARETMMRKSILLRYSRWRLRPDCSRCRRRTIRRGRSASWSRSRRRGTDLLGRLVAGELTQRLGHQFFVKTSRERRRKSAPTLSPNRRGRLHAALDGQRRPLVLPAVKASVPYKIPDDFAFIAGVSQMPFAVSINAKVPIKSMAELIAYAKANQAS